MKRSSSENGRSGVLERVVENWLTRVNERSFEVPFAQLLAGEGYQVVHLSRHGPFEEGKDILAIAPNGAPCAFQLKGAPNGRITQNFWTAECLGQAIRLVEIPIVHPSIDSQLPRRVYFVTNGELEEEVRLEITHRNTDWEHRGHPKLETVVKGQLLARFRDLHTDLWPVELVSERTLLEFFLADGNECLDKARFSEFLLSMLPLFDEELNKAECSRALASTAIVTAYALSPYAERLNHVALIEGWMVYISCLVALVEKYGLEPSYWQDTLDISAFAVEQALDALCDELKKRKYLIEGEPLVDAPFYRGRVTWLAGLVSVFALWQRFRDPSRKIENWFESFVRSHQKDLLLWGEAAVPQFLAVFWLLRQFSATMEPDSLLTSLIESICNANEAEFLSGLPDPYHRLGDVVMEQFGMSEDPPTETYYKGRSYTLESLVHLLARRGWRQRLRFLWPKITRLHHAEFQVASPWEFCLWRAENGNLAITQPKMPQSWAELKDQARQVDASLIPQLFQTRPELLLAFVLVYPHRLTKDVAKFLDDCAREARLCAQ
jgi:hypothetical protein